MSTVLGIAPPDGRGEALTGLFLAAYLGLAVPVVALGVATQLLSARSAVSGFAALLVATVALVSRPLLRHSAGSGHRAGRDEPVAGPGSRPGEQLTVLSCTSVGSKYPTG